MLKGITDKLKKINPWHFLWISILFSEIVTFVSTVFLSYMYIGGLNKDILKITLIDAFIVPAIVAPFVIYFVKQTAKVRELNELLQQKIVTQKQAEDQVKASLNEKELLLREIHHRVKNNIQVISSLMNLQKKHLKNRDSIRIVEDTQNRIRSMAYIHENLYKSKDIAKVNFNIYLKDMINNMFKSYGLNSHRIVLKTDVEDVAFGVDTAIPCGLIIHELVSNSFKHAFAGDRDGVIKVSLRRNDKAEVELTISDNGVGIPEDVDFRNTDSLGLNLVNALVGQLDGKIELNREKGTEFIITFCEITDNRS